MSDTAAVQVEGLGKRYLLQHEDRALLRKLFLAPFRRDRQEPFWAVRDVSFAVEPGESIAILGENGSGKSTLLKVLAGITEASAGSFALRGRLGALVELGAGFHPALTGRENVMLNGVVAGVERTEMDRLYPEVVAFAELESFMDIPVRHYSSGMLARLGFALAVATAPDVLLVDEVLAVGDERFQRKCLDKIKEFQERGVTIVFVSHSMRLVQQVCSRGLLLHGGRLIADESVDAAVGLYLARVGAADAERRDALRDRARDGRFGGVEASIEQVRLTDVDGQPRTAFEMGETARIEIRYNAHAAIDDASVSLHVWSEAEDALLYGVNTRMDELPLFALEESGVLAIRLTGLQLLRGRYMVSIKLNRGHGQMLDQHDRRVGFEILTPRDDPGVVHMDHVWEIDGKLEPPRR